MKKISSKSMALYKRFFPVLWIALIGIVIAGIVTQDLVAKEGVVMLIAPCVMGVIGFVLIWRFLGKLADEVYDDGDTLVVRKRGQEHRVPLTDIMNVSSTVAANLPRITLKLTGASATGPLGAEVTFAPQTRLSHLDPFAKDKLAEDLIVRVDKARSGARA